MDRRQLLLAGVGLTVPALIGAGPDHLMRTRSVPLPQAAMVTRWDRDRWSRGSYSALPAGVSPSVRRTIADAFLGGRVALAGEYCNSDYPATTQGAYLSGVYAARRLQRKRDFNSVMIIGAGLAGAAAANQLRDAGVEVTVLEARDRIGGRIHSDRRWGTPVELGAAWLHSLSNNPLVDLARDDGLTLVPTNYDDAVARDTKTGKVSAKAERRWTRLEGLIDRLEEAWPARSTTVEQWLRRRDWTQSRIDRWAAQVEIAGEYGLDPDRLGVRATEEGGAYRGGDAMLAGGYDAIPRRLLEGIDVRLNAPVVSVSASDQQVTAVLNDGATFTADVAIVAVPLALLQADSLRLAPMDPVLRRALGQLTTGNLEKVVLRYDEQWWGRHQVYGIVGGGAPGAPAGSSAALRWTEFYDLTEVVGFPALAGLSGGSAARHRPRLNSQSIREATQALAAAFGQ